MRTLNSELSGKWAPKEARLITWARIISAILFILVIIGFMAIYCSIPPVDESHMLIRPEIQREVIQKLIRHKLPLNTLVSFNPEKPGIYRYFWAGKWVKL